MRRQRAGHIGRRRRWLLGLSVAGLLLVPAALAWACNPQAHINLNQTSFAPGSPITVYGSFFPGGKSITVSGPTGSTSVTTSSGGAFATTLTAPSAPGDYVISASKPTGGSAPASFAVVTQQAAAPAPVVPTRPAAPSSSAPSFSVPTVHRSGTPAARAPAPAPAATAPSSVVTAAPVTPASVAPATVVATPVTAGTAPAARATHTGTARHGTARQAQPAPASTAPTTSQLAATSDLWSGFAPGRSASLVSATPGGMAGGGTSSALTIGIAVLALGLIALVAGLTGAELRRRRATAIR